MPIIRHIKPEAHLVVLVHVGVVPDDEFLESYRAFLEDPALDRSANLLVDLRQSDASARTAATLRRFARLVQRHYDGQDVRPKAAVVAPQDLTFGLSRLYEAYSDNTTMEVEVFRDLDTALDWLGVAADVVADLDRETRAPDAADGS